LLALLALLSACGGEPQPDSGGAADGAPTAPLGVYGVAPAAVAGSPSVVTLRGGPAPPPSERQPVMDQLGLVFAPTTLIARVGEPVMFTNSETIVHNVRLTFSDNDSTVFDEETDPNQRVEFVPRKEGGYEVTCDHHPGMRAFIYATTAEHAVFADNSGRFTLTDVPPGTYTLSVWNVDPARRVQRTVEVTGPSTEVMLP
jgi:plastocyanin